MPTNSNLDINMEYSSAIKENLAEKSFATYGKVTDGKFRKVNLAIKALSLLGLKESRRYKNI